MAAQQHADSESKKDRQNYYRLCLVRAKRKDATPEYDYFIVTNKGCIYNIKHLIYFLFNKRINKYEKVEMLVDAPYSKVYDLVYREIIDYTEIPFENHKIDNVDSYLYDNFMIKFKPELQYMAVVKFLRLFLYRDTDKQYVKKEVIHGSLLDVIFEIDLTQRLEDEAIYDQDNTK